MSKHFVVITILLSTFSILGFCESEITPRVLYKMDLRTLPSDPAYIKTVKKQLRELKWEHIQLEKKCKADIKKYFVENCRRGREKITIRTERLVREIASYKLN